MLVFDSNTIVIQLCGLWVLNVYSFKIKQSNYRPVISYLYILSGRNVCVQK